MGRVILQPSSSKNARQHFVSNIETPIELADIIDFLSEADLAALRVAHPDGRLQLWGAKRGETEQNVKRWNQIEAGDRVLFNADKRVFASATVTHKMRNLELAQFLWGTGETKGGISQPWELMFAVAELRAEDLKYGALNRLLEWKDNAVPQKFDIVDQKHSDAILDYLNLQDSSYATVKVSEYKTVVLSSQFAELERQSTHFRRLEQESLRGTLMPGPAAECALCGRVFPVRLLIAAHIKRRAICSRSEKLMFSDVAMPACMFGCDALFGQGLIGVNSDGAIVASDLLPGGEPTAYFNDRLAGRACSAWQNQAARQFFAFHFSSDFVRSPQPI